MSDAPATSYQERITAAHATGHLFAHMFETPVESRGIAGDGGGFSASDLFKVMAQKPGSVFTNGFGSDYEPTMDGIVGLSTTAVREGYPIPLFNERSNLGLLMDTAKPIFVHPKDAMTKTKDGVLHFGLTGIRHNMLMRIQGITDRDWQNYSPFSLITRSLATDKIQEYIENGESALSQFWEQIVTQGWDAYLSSVFHGIASPGMNEVNVAAKLGDVCGIVVYKGTGKNGDSYSSSIKAAQEVQKYLAETYPETFREPPPIMEYTLSRNLGTTTPTMQELTRERIAAIRRSGRDFP